MARRVKLRRNPGAGDLPYDEWIPAHAVKFNSHDGSTSLMTETHRASNRGRRRRRNVAAGWVEEETGIFHPIRASYDYSRSRAGEKPVKKRRAKAKKRKAKAKTRRRR